MKSNNLSTIAISLTIVLSAIILSYAFMQRNSNNNTITVTGLAERNFESDLIVWKSQFTVKNPTLTSAYSEIKKQSQDISNFLSKKGIDKDAITTIAPMPFRPASWA